MAQKVKRRNREMLGIQIKPKEGLWVNYQLRLKGSGQQKLADQLGVREQSVNQVLYGKRRSGRIEEALYRTLGYPSFEAMLAAARGHDGGAA
jgi:hypothetical protein